MSIATRPACWLILAVISAFIAGCNGSSSSVADSGKNTVADPLAWFDELGRRATQRDAEFVRAHARPHVLAERPAAKAGAATSDPAVALCDALMFSQPLESAPTKDPKRIIISAAQYSAGVFGGSAWEYSIDLYREKDGWKVDSWPYGHRALSSTPIAPLPEK